MSRKISTSDIQPQKQLFHNQKLNVYPKKIKFEDIKFWPNNSRTELAFDILEAQKNKPIESILDNEITEFLVKRPELELIDLSDSITRNGVRVPLIVCKRQINHISPSPRRNAGRGLG